MRPRALYSLLSRVVARHQLFQRHDAVTLHSGPSRKIPKGKICVQIRLKRKNTFPCEQKRPRSSKGNGTSLPKKKAKEEKKKIAKIPTNINPRAKSQEYRQREQVQGCRGVKARPPEAT